MILPRHWFLWLLAGLAVQAQVIVAWKVLAWVMGWG